MLIYSRGRGKRSAILTCIDLSPCPNLIYHVLSSSDALAHLHRLFNLCRLNFASSVRAYGSLRDYPATMIVGGWCRSVWGSTIDRAKHRNNSITYHIDNVKSKRTMITVILIIGTFRVVASLRLFVSRLEIEIGGTRVAVQSDDGLMIPSRLTRDQEMAQKEKKQHTELGLGRHHTRSGMVDIVWSNQRSMPLHCQATRSPEMQGVLCLAYR